MCVCKYLNQSKDQEEQVKRMENLSRFFQYLERLSFITQFKIEFLLLLTGCRKMLGKMPELTY